MERLDTYALAAVGLAKGVFEVYIKPLPSDMLSWMTGKLLPFEVDFDAIEAHLKEVAAETQQPDSDIS